MDEYEIEPRVGFSLAVKPTVKFGFANAGTYMAYSYINLGENRGYIGGASNASPVVVS